VLACLTLDAAVAARSGFGGTAPARVVEQIERFRVWLTGFADWTRKVER
jgi:argininosuccinate lyase